jgi:gamma-glutamyltranspeptidase/glutathione hydrolase
MTVDSVQERLVAASRTRALRPEAVGTRHAVAAGHPLAALAAYRILEAGGNAVDAGVAGGICLGVVHPDLVSFAGVAPIMIYDARRHAIETISGVGPWPRRATVDLFRREHGGEIPDGLRRTVVPAAPDAWLTALERHGTLGFAEVAGPAIELARDGFPMGAFARRSSKQRGGLWRGPARRRLPPAAAHRRPASASSRPTSRAR